ncbi:MAG: recombination-associated protein RdgC [Syntrophales bacterium]|jgi:recombination associated protein RdgC|nr:recombination-associated protein RdgC [Syntrophales bacterium]MDY0044403.1 recombination-associated protein RdgC [Syntrophales bacterium]
MGLLKGSATFTRYRVIGEMQDGFRDFFDTQIKLHSFKEISTGLEEKSTGWTSSENVLDTDFQYAGYSLGDYVLFCLRIDRKNIPPALLKLKVLEAEKKYAEENNLKKIYKEQRAEIRETVRRELLAHTAPVPSFYEVCWALSESWLILGTLSANVFEDFEELFKRSFNLIPVHFVPWDPAFADSETASALAMLKK